MYCDPEVIVFDGLDQWLEPSQKGKGAPPNAPLRQSPEKEGENGRRNPIVLLAQQEQPRASGTSPETSTRR